MDAVFQATAGAALFKAASALAANGCPPCRTDHRLLRASRRSPRGGNRWPRGSRVARARVSRGRTDVPAGDGHDLRLGVPRGALERAGAGSVPIDTAAPGEPVGALIERWRRDGIDWVIAIERCGPSPDGTPRNMRGRDLSEYTAPLDRLFSAGPWQTIGIGDGGNELGMGSVPRALIAEHVKQGAGDWLRGAGRVPDHRRRVALGRLRIARRPCLAAPNLGGGNAGGA